MEVRMVKYNLKSDYEVIAKHCPKCESLVMAQVIKTLEGDFYKYRNIKCSSCDWSNPTLDID
jgi:MinD superfamily P-loop ATPase